MVDTPEAPKGGTVTLPGLGKVKRVYVYGGLAVVGVLGIMWYRNRSANATSSTTGAPATGTSSTGSTDAYPSDGSTGNASDPYSIDPSTGVTYGDEALGGYAGYGDGYGGSGSTTVSPNSGPGTFTDNADWSQYAENYLVGTSGMDAGTVANALGLYITGQPVTTSQEQVINDAIAIAGTPPVSGHNNQPPGINVSGSKTGGGPSSPLAAPTGLSVTPYAGYADFGWGKVSGATIYELQVEGAGGKGTGTSHVDRKSADNHAEKISLAPGAYTAKVRAGTSSTSITGKWSPAKRLVIPAAKK